jgi:hypothetical protein
VATNSSETLHKFVIRTPEGYVAGRSLSSSIGRANTWTTDKAAEEYKKVMVHHHKANEMKKHLKVVPVTVKISED